MATYQTLTRARFQEAIRELTTRDEALRRIVCACGPPPLWARKQGFPTLLRVILEQQVSLASARAAYDRLLAIASPLTPARFLQLDDAALRSVGFSRQKTTYGRNLAQAMICGSLRLERLRRLGDDAARDALLQVKGIGRWTADVYLLMALRRPDIWPSGDLAVAVAVQRALRLHAIPTPSELEDISARWRPWRAVAARMLWHLYLSADGKKI